MKSSALRTILRPVLSRSSEVFNKKMVTSMRGQWKFLGVTEKEKSVGVGCPQFMRGRQELFQGHRSNLAVSLHNNL